MIQSETECWDEEVQNPPESVDYHKFPLVPSAILLVDNPLSFESFLDSGLQVSHCMSIVHYKLISKYLENCYLCFRMSIL